MTVLLWEMAVTSGTEAVVKTVSHGSGNMVRYRWGMRWVFTLSRRANGCHWYQRNNNEGAMLCMTSSVNLTRWSVTQIAGQTFGVFCWRRFGVKLTSRWEAVNKAYTPRVCWRPLHGLSSDIITNTGSFWLSCRWPWDGNHIRSLRSLAQLPALQILHVLVPTVVQVTSL